MLYDMLFHNWECPLQNMAFSNFWQKKLELPAFMQSKINFNVDVA